MNPAGNSIRGTLEQIAPAVLPGQFGVIFFFPKPKAMDTDYCNSSSSFSLGTRPTL